MPRSIVAGSLALAAAGLLPFTPSVAQSGSDPSASTRAAITVTAPRARQTGRTAYGAPIETLTAQSVVYIDDLNLRTEQGRDELSDRVELAAQRACKWLDEVYPFQKTTSDTECKLDAVKRAQAQVDAAIAQSS